MLFSRSGAAALSVASNIFLVLVKLTVGVLSGSISIVSEAIHSFLDLVAALIAFFAVRAAGKPADEVHPFGHGKLENISGAIEAGLIFVASAFIIYEAGNRVAKGARVELVEVGIGVMALSVLVNTLVSRHLLRVSRATESIALEADARHLTSDVYTSIGVAGGLMAVRLTGFNLLDPLIAFGIALLILKTAYEVLRKSSTGLLDVKLPADEEAVIRSSVVEHCGELVGLHNLRTRKSGGERYIDLHLVMAKEMHLDEAHRVCDHLEEDIKAKLPRASVTIHVEPCDEKCEQCSVSCSSDRRIQYQEEAAIRTSIVEHCGELVGFHDLYIQKAGEERHVDLHLVMAKELHLDEVHRMCDHLEEDIKAKLPRTQVTIHVEPCD